MYRHPSFAAFKPSLALIAAVTALAFAAAPSAASGPVSALDDPFDDGLLDPARPAPAPPANLPVTPQASHYADRADAAVSQLAQRRSRWRPFRWMSAETSWYTPQPAPPAQVLSVVDSPAPPPAVSAAPAPLFTWHGMSFFAPSANKNIWLAYPVYLEKFAGAFLADEPIEGKLHSGVGFLAGLRTGWDYAEHWGVESRAAFARTQLGGPTLPTEAHENFVIWDAMWLYYPWANTVWRPFLLAGPGLTFVSFIDERGTRLDQTFFHVPVGIGIKHRFGNQHAFRFDVVDNLLFSQIYPRHIDNQFSFVGGFEWRFGNPLP